jgi:hypothetical protein
MKLDEMMTPMDALRWALHRIETAGLGCGEYFARAEALLNAAPAVPTQVYSYWPDGSRQYTELDHWPQRNELPATAVCFEMAVPDPTAAKRPPDSAATALEAAKAENIRLQQRVEWLERLHLYREDGHSDVHDGMSRP